MTYSSPEFGGLSSAVTDALRKGTFEQNELRDTVVAAMQREGKEHEAYLRQLQRERDEQFRPSNPYCILCGKGDVTSEDQHVVGGKIVHAHPACVESLRRSLAQREPGKPVRPMGKSFGRVMQKSCAVPFRVQRNLSVEQDQRLREELQRLVQKGFSPNDVESIYGEVKRILSPDEIGEIMARYA